VNLLANENIPLRSIEALRRNDHDILAIAQTNPGLDDATVLQIATDQTRIILTYDHDYGELIFRRSLDVPPGVVLFRFTPEFPAEPAELFEDVIASKNLKLDGMFTVLERTALRQRPID